MMNYFNDNEAALRYSRGRADFHHLITKRLKHFFGETFHIQHALDIACGTGLSTKALLPIAKQVFGTDASANMIKHAAKNSRIKFSIADAEQQPFTGNNFELITVCSGIHWFDIDKFLQETNRLLKTKGWLIIYDNFFIPELEKNTEFKLWHENYYLTKFPAPLRNSQYNWSNQHLKNKNFKLK